MQCVDYERHELECNHDRPFGKSRWKAADGCSGSVCGRCLAKVVRWPDLSTLDALDRRGLPLNPERWTDAERQINASDAAGPR